jgi:hypothetical protein
MSLSTNIRRRKQMFNIGDRVKLRELLWEIIKIAPLNSFAVSFAGKLLNQNAKKEDLWARLIPIDIHTNAPASIVLTKDGKYIPDPYPWLKQYNNSNWAKGGHGSFGFLEVLNEYTAAHGGAASFVWNRSLTIPLTTLEEKGEQVLWTC